MVVRNPPAEGHVPVILEIEHNVHDREVTDAKQPALEDITMEYVVVRRPEGDGQALAMAEIEQAPQPP